MSFAITRMQLSLCAGVLALLLNGCVKQAARSTHLLGQNDHYAVVVAGPGETTASLADRFLGDPAMSWRIEDANGISRVDPGQRVIVPLQPVNRIGVFSNGYQTVPVISYHRFGAGRGRLSLATEAFKEQMAYLQDHGYRVIPLADVLAFMRGKGEIPQRSVVLTIDDGYRSVYHIAFPVLKKYGFPATVFIYTDYIGNGGLSWKQMAEMHRSGLISFQPHSKTHSNLTLSEPAESIDAYLERLDSEIRLPKALLSKRIKEPIFSYAYPFGAVNRPVVEELKANDLAVGVTVDRGGNPFFAYPYALRRTMIYQQDGVAEFAAALQVFEAVNLQ